ncbi:hypothetical protein ANAPC5_01242 [Anaplasma phagocytophilum]|nr:hypothetical protein ANAPC5_01242 [Anaplasma phagocytophilum]
MVDAAPALSFSQFVACEGYYTILLKRPIRSSNSDGFRLLRPYFAATGVKKESFLDTKDKLRIKSL